MLTKNVRMTQWTYDMFEMASRTGEILNDLTLDELFEYALFSYAKIIADHTNQRRMIMEELRDHMEADI